MYCFYSFLSHSGLFIANIGWLDYSSRFQTSITIRLLSVLFLLYMFCCSKLLPTTSGYYKSQYWNCLCFRFKQKNVTLAFQQVQCTFVLIFVNDIFEWILFSKYFFTLLYFLFFILKWSIWAPKRKNLLWSYILFYHHLLDCSSLS